MGVELVSVAILVVAPRPCCRKPVSLIRFLGCLCAAEILVFEVREPPL
jgi:hypothetical protein